MLGEPDLVVAKLLGESRLRELIDIEIGEGLAPRRRISKRKQQPDIQIFAYAHGSASTWISSADRATSVFVFQTPQPLTARRRAWDSHPRRETFRAIEEQPE